MNLLRTVTLLSFVMLAAAALSLITTEGAEAADYDIDLIYEDHPVYFKMARGMNPVTFNFTIKHTGDYPSEEVGIKLRNPPTNWNIVYSATTSTDVYLGAHTPDKPFEIMLQKGGTADMIVTVTPAPKQLNKTYLFDLNVYPLKDAPRNHSVLFGVYIPQVASFVIKLWGPKVGGQLPPDVTYSAFPPSNVSLQFAVYNRGNGIDRFRIQGTSSRESEGWNITFTKGVDDYATTPNLTANTPESSPHIVEVEVSIPAGAQAGLTSQITMTATSMFNSSMQMPPALAKVKAMQLFDLNVDYYLPEGPVYQGRQAVFRLNVTNLGNGDDIFEITAELDGPGPDTFPISIDPDELDLEAGEFGRVTISIGVPEDAYLGTYGLHTFVTSTLNESNNLGTTLDFEVLEAHGVRISAEVSYNSTIPGGVVEFMVQVENTGIDLDSYRFGVFEINAEWVFEVKPLEMTLLSGQSGEAAVRVIVPADYALAPMGIHGLWVVSKSIRNDAEHSLLLSVEVLQYFRIEWMKDDEPLTTPPEPVNPVILGSVDVNPFADEPSSIQVELHNFGNGLDNVTIGASSNDERVSIELDPELMPLLTMSGDHVTVTITVPEDMPTETYQVMLTADSQDPDFVTREVRFGIDVVHLDIALPLYPTYLQPEGDATVVDKVQLLPDEEASFQLNVRNNGTVPLSNVLIRGWDVYGPEGDEEGELIFEFTIPFIPVADKVTIGGQDYDGAPSIEWSTDVIGVHELVFEATLPHQVDTSNDRSSVTVVVKDPPEVKVDETDIKVTEGDKLVVTGTVDDDIGDIEWVKVRVDNGTWEEANGTSEWSVEIDTEEMEPGEHRFEAVASDGHTESQVLDTTFEVEERYKVDESPGFGLVIVLLAVITAAIILRRGRL